MNLENAVSNQVLNKTFRLMGSKELPHNSGGKSCLLRYSRLTALHRGELIESIGDNIQIRPIYINFGLQPYFLNILPRDFNANILDIG